MEDFCVSKEGNTSQDIQDLFDLAVWAGSHAYCYIYESKRMFEYVGVVLKGDYFGISFGKTFFSNDVDDLFDGNIFTYEQAIDHILNGE